jgi:hypothetical protein
MWQADIARVGLCLVEFSPGGGQWVNLAGGAVATDANGMGLFGVQLADTLAGVPVVSDSCFIRLRSAMDTTLAVVVGPFSIHAHPFVVFSPVAGDTFSVGDTIAVSWTADTTRITACRLELSPDGGVTWIPLVGGVITRTGTEWLPVTWVVPDSVGGVWLAGSDCALRLNEEGGKATVTVFFAVRDEAGEPEPEPDDGCGCGSGTGLALLPPVGYKLFGRRRKRKKRAARAQQMEMPQRH